MRISPALALAFAAPLALTACGDPVDPDKLEEAAAEPTTPPLLEEEPGEPEGIAEAAELEADENVPALAEVQVALAQCNYEQDVIEATCTASEAASEFTCVYSLDGDTPETMREAFIAADGESYTLIEIPEDCPVQ